MSLKSILFSLPLFSSLVACTITPPTGELIEGHLRPCPNRPNCVNSDSNATERITPISFQGSPEQAYQQIETIIKKIGGKIVKTNSKYLWATFTSTLFHFVDDVELRIEPEQHLIHIRSGARMGYSDFGVNKRRVAKIRKFFSQTPREKVKTIPGTVRKDV